MTQFTSRISVGLAGIAAVTVLLAMAVAAGGQTVPARTAVGTEPAVARNGLIVFMRPGRIGEYDLWVVRPDGEGLRRLTKSPRARSDYNPDWSPDGSTVLFQRNVLEGQNDGDDLYVVKADGSGLRQLTTCARDCWGDVEASWSPDGGRIAFGRVSGPRDVGHPSLIAIYVMNADGTAVRQLSAPPQGYEDHYPTWSPDGTTIVFQRDTNANPPGPTELVAVDASTGAEHHVYTLPPWANGAGVAKFAPDGNRILFSFWCIYGDGCPSSSRTARNARLATIRPDGSGLEVLQLKTRADSGSWSPDGKKIAFRCHAKTGFGFNLCTSRMDGTGLKRFPWQLDSAHPDWGTHP